MTLLAQISPSQAQKELTANEDFNAVSPAGFGGRKYSTTTGLVWGYYGGYLQIAGVNTSIADGTVTLTNAATNYIEMTVAGVVSANQVGFTAGRIPLYSAVCAGGVITGWTDFRTFALGLTGGGFTGFAFAVNEDCGGTMNGINATFTVANIPVSGTEALYLNGMRLRKGTGYTIVYATKTITMLAGYIPAAGDTLVADYRY